MDSFIKDVLSAIILAGWVFPVIYLTLALVAGKLAALYRLARGSGQPGAPRRTQMSARPAPMKHDAPAARHNPVRTAAVTVPVARMMRPRVASRWKSSQRVSTGAC
ncbi:MAG: hypothetical protein SF172_08475 [Burkholderiales bacterium]|nr:hypothetical protein [Burkholderiales bacterium]